MRRIIDPGLVQFDLESNCDRITRMESRVQCLITILNTLHFSLMDTLKHNIWGFIVKCTLLLHVGLMIMGCTYQKEFPDASLEQAWPRIVNRNQHKKAYYLHWQNEAREVHYAYITSSAFCAWLKSYEDIPGSIKDYTGLPQEVKATGRLDEVHIYLYDFAEDPYSNTIEIERRWIRTIVVRRYDEGLKGLSVFARILAFIVDILLNGEYLIE